MLRCARYTAQPALLALAFASGLLSSPSVALTPKDKPIPAVRWSEERPGCTFSRSDDGKYRYGLWYEDVGITLAVDSQEVEKVRRRHEPFFAVLVDVRYRGHSALQFETENISLEFVDHFHAVQTSLDPEAFSAKVQNDADELDHETAREVGKHPEKKEAKEAYERAFQKDASELLEFVSKNSLRSKRMDAAIPETSGWIFFSTNSKWIGRWKKQEEFILRVPVNGTMFEFPFKLPPTPGEVILRKRD